MIELNFSFAWDPEWWAFGVALVPHEEVDRTVKCIAFRLVCFGMDIMYTKFDGEKE